MIHFHKPQQERRECRDGEMYCRACDTGIKHEDCIEDGFLDITGQLDSLTVQEKLAEGELCVRHLLDRVEYLERENVRLRGLIERSCAVGSNVTYKPLTADSLTSFDGVKGMLGQ